MRVLLNVKGKKVVAEVSSSVKELQGELGKAKARAEEMHYAIVNFASVSTMFANMQTIMMPPNDLKNHKGEAKNAAPQPSRSRGYNPAPSDASFSD